MPSLLYIGYSHDKASPDASRLLELLKTTYNVTQLESESNIDALEKRNFDVVVCAQLLPERKMIDGCISFNHGVCFLEHEESLALSASRFLEYNDFQFICVSQALHNELMKLGLNSHFVQHISCSETDFPEREQMLQIMQLIEEPAPQKPHVLVDISVLRHGLGKSAARAGIFSVAYNVLLGLFAREDLRVSLYCHSADYEVMRSGIKTIYPESKEHLLFDEKTEFTQFDAFFSPVYSIPNHIKRLSHIKNFTILYDCIVLIHPEWFINNEPFWFKELVIGINSQDYYFSISNFTTSDFIKCVPDIDKSHVKTIPLGANSNFYHCTDKIKIEKAKKTYGIPVNKKYILSLCSLEPRKNLIRSAQAFIEFLKEDSPQDLVYVLAGGTWEGFEKLILEKIPELSKHNDSIIRTGYIADEDLAPLYSGAEFFVYTSMYEGFGLPPLEAMQCGIPVITSNNTSLPEVVGDAGLMIPYDSLEAHVEAFRKLYYDDELRKKLVQAGLQRTKLFTWEACTDIIADQIISCVPKLDTPPISIVTVVHDLIRSGCDESFRHCLESVQNQKYLGKIEHFVIDQCSTDDTKAFLQIYEEKGWIRTLSTATQNLHDAMNLCQGHATGKYVTFLTPDAHYHSPLAVSTYSRVLERSKADYVYGDALVIDRKTGTESVWKGRLGNLPFGTHYCHQALFVRTDVLREMTCFTPQHSSATESDLAIQLVYQNKKSAYLGSCHVTLNSYLAEDLEKRSEHANAFYQWFGKELNLTRDECCSLYRVQGLQDLCSEQARLTLAKLVKSEWFSAVLELYASGKSVCTISEHSTPPPTWGMKIGYVVAQSVDYLLAIPAFHKFAKLVWNMFKGFKSLVNWIRALLDRASLHCLPQTRASLAGNVHRLKWLNVLLRAMMGKAQRDGSLPPAQLPRLHQALLLDVKSLVKKSILPLHNWLQQNSKTQKTYENILNRFPLLAQKLNKKQHVEKLCRDTSLFYTPTDISDLSPRGKFFLQHLVKSTDNIKEN